MRMPVLQASRLRADDRALISMELQRFFSFPWNLRLCFLIVPAIWLSLWQHVPSPFVPIFGALFIGLEPQFCNIFFRTANEFEALSVLPVPWPRIVLAKNLSTILITLICLPIISIIVLFFSPDIVPASQFWKAALYLASVIFPLLHAGNLQSLHHPRRRMGWEADDLAGGLLMACTVGVLSLPYLILVEGVGAPVLCLLYAGAGAYFYLRHSVHQTARRVIEARSVLCAAR
ncbi:MAG: hypothetical protein H6Q30_839 [Bacteroidetes bacterium]|nr:hypothetical protein [Bacteroidota bacterium]